MARKANKSTPTVISGFLSFRDGNTNFISLSDRYWLMWLEDATSFYYEHETGGFSARKQQHRHEFFWYAYKRINGKLYKRYLGTKQALTKDRLEAMAVTFSQVAKIGGVATQLEIPNEAYIIENSVGNDRF